MATMRAKIVEEMNKPPPPPTTPPPFMPSVPDPDVDGTLPPQPDNHKISVKVRGNTGGLDPHNVPIGSGDFNGLENVVIDLSQVRIS